VVYKFIAAEGLPQLGYLTLLDQFMLGAIAFLVLMAIENFAASKTCIQLLFVCFPVCMQRLAAYGCLTGPHLSYQSRAGNCIGERVDIRTADRARHASGQAVSKTTVAPLN
jgi:hypothetical protein